MTLSSVLNWIGGLICHQLPARTLVIGGEALPVCVRCTGIYLGIFTAGAFILCARRAKGNVFPNSAAPVLLALCVFPMMADGVSSALGLRETTNAVRMVTGVLFGVSGPFLALPVLNFDPAGKRWKNIASIFEISGAWACALILAASVFAGVFPSWALISLVICFTIIAVWIFLWRCIIHFILRWGRKYVYRK